MKKFILLSILSCFYTIIYAQNVGINSDGSSPDASAMLDIVSSDKGILIPRVDLDDASTAAPITSPAIGLLIYNQGGDEPDGFYYWTGTLWSPFSGDADWTISGTDIYSAVTDDVGIGITDPLAKFHVYNEKTGGADRTGAVIDMRVTNGNNGNSTIGLDAKARNTSWQNTGNLYGVKAYAQAGGNSANSYGTAYGLFSESYAKIGDAYGIYSIAETHGDDWDEYREAYGAYLITRNMAENAWSSNRINLWGIYNDVTSAATEEMKGIYNELDGEANYMYGTYNNISTLGFSPGVTNATALYGTYNTVNGANSNTAYGIYSKASGATTNYAGYFDGLVEVANTTSNTAQLNLVGTISNQIYFNSAGVALPTTTTRSAGTKLVLYPSIGGASVDYAIGINGFTQWYSVPQNNASYKHAFYAGTSEIFNVQGDGVTNTGSFIELSSIGSGDRNAVIDFHSSDGTDYDLRIYRTPGANGFAQFVQNGTAEMQFYTNNGAALNLRMISDGSLCATPTYSATVGATNRDLFIDDAGKIGYVSSSKRYKNNISDMENIDWIYNLRPVNYTYKTDEHGIKQYGLIAEEVEKINPLFVSYNEDGQVETVQYSAFISPLIKTVQDQKSTIDILMSDIENLENKNQKLSNEISELKNEIEIIKKNLKIDVNNK